ncbi:hypothetical protein [Geosporobacter ferrireducens]|uniref:Sialidase domain-containing protein n=1 Tax=Geosporobacter ferrireducens TaxID=1424294 RepID=A0A1D8GC42_9FIRM|nr:hypothetical protein [Geosporobacter ferrireducens]AOT68495.1 hypothetical protein Gferi_02135 [Geosporobacter ferrireducens]MTI53957.1 hypothetical protein [Geosporobacter ferrireducens]
MSFANQKNALVTDQAGNIHSFRWDNEKIIYACFYKHTKKMEKEILVEACMPEFDVIIDKKDTIYLTCQQKEGKLLLFIYRLGIWEREVLLSSEGINIYNLSVISWKDGLYIFYCVPSFESNKVYRIYYLYRKDEIWRNAELGDIRVKTLLNPLQVLSTSQGLILGYYNLVNGAEQLFIKLYDGTLDLWRDTLQVTDGLNDKLYIDILLVEEEELNIVYSEYIDGNLVVKYEKYKMAGNKLIKKSEYELSNPGNCSYPTLIMFDNMLWTVWTEYDYVASSFSEDNGMTWSVPYQWTESKEGIFVRYKYCLNPRNSDRSYLLNYSYGKDFPDFTFLGFGSFEKAVEMPLITKKKREEEVEEILSIPENQENDLVEVNHEIIEQENLIGIKEKLLELEDRIEQIENFINRRRRGFLFPPRE